MSGQQARALVLDSRKRVEEKHAQRQRDLAELQRGGVAVEDLRQRNGVIAGALKGARIDMSRVRSLG